MSLFELKNRAVFKAASAFTQWHGMLRRLEIDEIRGFSPLLAFHFFVTQHTRNALWRGTADKFIQAGSSIEFHILEGPSSMGGSAAQGK